MTFKYIFIISVLVMSSLSIAAQSYNFYSECEEQLEFPFISDGHDYSLEINKNDKGEFKTTFYSGSTYRIISCSNLPQGRVIFTVYDTEKNELFCNKNYNYTSYWDFHFKSTIDCIVVVTFESEIVNKAQIKFLIGFKSE